MNIKVGLLGVLAMAAVGLFHPAAASAQDRDYSGRDGYRGGAYAQQRYQDDRGWRGNDRYRDHEWREAREREEWRERQWREQQRCERRDQWRGYGYGYRQPAIGFGFRWYGR